MSRGSREAGAAATARWIGLGLGPLLCVALWHVDLDAGRPEAARMAAIGAWMAVWWFTEAVPLAATALLPLVLFPLAGLMPTSAVAPVYVNSTIFLFLGGFLIALGMESSGLHRRIAVGIIGPLGGGPARLVLGFMVASAVLSMWISNTATAVMMLPIAMAVVRGVEEHAPAEAVAPLGTALMLGVAYACSIGGMATLVGTPPNLALERIYAITFPAAAPLAFGQWMLLGVPLAAVMLVLTWLLLTRVFFRAPAAARPDPQVIAAERRALGPISTAEVAVAVVFALTALLWVFRRDLVLGATRLPGWSRLLPEGAGVDDGTVAVAMALLLFLLPGRRSDGAPARLLDGEVFRRVPWGIVLLFGGGFALAKGIHETGLSEVAARGLAGLSEVPPMALVLIVCLGLTFLTELTSNTATAQTVLPILAATAVALRVHPLLLMVPAALSASCAFMMPVATPPNAIVFSSGRVTVGQMARVGLLLNLVGAVVISLLFTWLAPTLLGVDLWQTPEWAE